MDEFSRNQSYSFPIKLKFGSLEYLDDFSKEGFRLDDDFIDDFVTDKWF